MHGDRGTVDVQRQALGEVTLLGAGTYGRADPFVHPTSFDVGADGRIYILDAGNARIVVFSSSRRYITEWGTFADGEGEFNFGSGALTGTGDRAFAGILVVDDEGFIYVVDEANQRARSSRLSEKRAKVLPHNRDQRNTYTCRACGV